MYIYLLLLTLLIVGVASLPATCDEQDVIVCNAYTTEEGDCMWCSDGINKCLPICRSKYLDNCEGDYALHGQRLCKKLQQQHRMNNNIGWIVPLSIVSCCALCCLVMIIHRRMYPPTDSPGGSGGSVSTYVAPEYEWILVKVRRR